MATAQYAGIWNFGPDIGNFGQKGTSNRRLAELIKKFGCGDEIVPLDPDSFGRRTCEIIAQGLSALRQWPECEATASTTDEKQQISPLELRSTTERTSLLNVLHNAPRSDRLTMLATGIASITLLLMAAGVGLLIYEEPIQLA